ncbi:MAG: metal ABC transporter solute-binding protein, Zn/Mn family, partial [Anaerolineae bacterium]
MALLGMAVLLVACARPTPPPEAGPEHPAPEVLPTLTPVSLGAGEKLRVVATTTLVGDVVARVGGDAIDLTVLLPPGADPHTYEPRPEQLRALS